MNWNYCLVRFQRWISVKRIDRLLKKARVIAEKVLVAILPGDEDEFMDALGVEKEKYAVEQRDGSIGYDFIKALGDIVGKVWNDD